MMKFCVCMKQVPDTQNVRVDPEKGTLIRKGIPVITNPFDESALELALELKDIIGGHVTVLTMGPTSSEEVVRDALSLGADRAFRITDGAFAGSDTLATSRVLGKAIQVTGPYDILLFGKQAIDGDTAQVGPEVAVFLGLPLVGFVTDVIEIKKNCILLERVTDWGRERVLCDYPLVITVLKAKNRLRMPKLEGIIRSFKEEIGLLTHKNLGLQPEKCGLKGSPTRVKKIFSPETRSRVHFIEGSVEEKAAEAVRLIKKLVLAD